MATEPERSLLEGDIEEAEKLLRRARECIAEGCPGDAYALLCTVDLVPMQTAAKAVAVKRLTEEARG